MEPPTIKGSCCLLRVCPARLPIVNSAPNIAFYRALTGSQPCTKLTEIVIKFSSPFTDTFMIHFSQLMKPGEDWLMLPQGGAEGLSRAHAELTPPCFFGGHTSKRPSPDLGAPHPPEFTPLGLFLQIPLKSSCGFPPTAYNCLGTPVDDSVRCHHSIASMLPCV